jgi:hypothetical protein
MIITLTNEQIEWCKNLAIKRSGSMNHSDTLNSQNFLKQKPSWYRHYVGVLGELAYSIHTGQAVDETTIGKGDSGIDFEDGVQVKASDTVNKPNLMFPVSQFNRKIAKNYVLAWVKLPEVELIGRITREKILEVKTTKDYGYGNTYFVSHSHLETI